MLMNTQKTRAYDFFPVMGSELAVLVKDEPVELRVYLRQSDALRVLTTVEDQYFNPRVIVEATSENVNLGDSGYQPRPSIWRSSVASPIGFPGGSLGRIRH